MPEAEILRTHAATYDKQTKHLATAYYACVTSTGFVIGLTKASLNQLHKELLKTG